MGNAGRKALHASLDKLAKGQAVDKKDVGIIFDGYAGKGEDVLMTVSQITNVFKDMVAYQKRVARNVINGVLKLYYVSPEYKKLGFLERGAVSVAITAGQTVLMTVFDTAMQDYTTKERMETMMTRFSGDGKVTRSAFVANAATIIGAELTRANLVVGEGVVKKGLKLMD